MITLFNELGSMGKFGKRFLWKQSSFYQHLLQQTCGAVPKKALGQFLKRGEHAEVAVVLVGSQKIRSLNRLFRGKDISTDVLTFDADKMEYPFLGEVVLCPSFAQKSAKKYGRPLEKEMALLFVHGVLHLLGYDHKAPADKKKMFALHDVILGEHISYD